MGLSPRDQRMYNPRCMIQNEKIQSQYDRKLWATQLLVSKTRLPHPTIISKTSTQYSMSGGTSTSTIKRKPVARNDCLKGARLLPDVCNFSVEEQKNPSALRWSGRFWRKESFNVCHVWTPPSNIKRRLLLRDDLEVLNQEQYEVVHVWDFRVESDNRHLPLLRSGT